MTALPLPVAVPGDLTLLDEDWAVACGVTNEAGEFDCDRPAAWLVWLVACCPANAKGGQWCTPHKDLWLSSDLEGSCLACGRVFTPLSSCFRLIEPLNRRTT